MLRVVLGLGSNLGDRHRALHDAVQALRGLPQVFEVVESSRRETAPVGLLQQPAFLNSALRLETSLAPSTLLEHALRIERALGRDRSMAAVRWGPRVIDIDLLWIDGLRVDLLDQRVQFRVGPVAVYS